MEIVISPLLLFHSRACGQERRWKLHGRGVIVRRVCWMCEDSAVAIQMFCCGKGSWGENERWALMGSKGRSGIIGFDYICLSEQGRLNRELELFWHWRRVSKFSWRQNRKNETGCVASSQMWPPEFILVRFAFLPLATWFKHWTQKGGGHPVSGSMGSDAMTSSVFCIPFFLLDHIAWGELPPPHPSRLYTQCLHPHSQKSILLHKGHVLTPTGGSLPQEPWTIVSNTMWFWCCGRSKLKWTTGGSKYNFHGYFCWTVMVIFKYIPHEQRRSLCLFEKWWKHPPLNVSWDVTFLDILHYFQ